MSGIGSAALQGVRVSVLFNLLWINLILILEI